MRGGGGGRHGERARRRRERRCLVADGRGLARVLRRVAERGEQPDVDAHALEKDGLVEVPAGDNDDVAIRDDVLCEVEKSRSGRTSTSEFASRTSSTSLLHGAATATAAVIYDYDGGAGALVAHSLCSCSSTGEDRIGEKPSAGTPSWRSQRESVAAGNTSARQRLSCAVRCVCA